MPPSGLHRCKTLSNIPIYQLELFSEVIASGFVKMPTPSETIDIEPTGAVARVFNTYELLEKILIEASKPKSQTRRARTMRDLYRFQRVSATFRNVIARSKYLRVAMFKNECQKHQTQSSHPKDDDSMERLLNLNPLMNSLKSFGLPLTHNPIGDFRHRDSNFCKGDEKLLRGSLPILNLSARELKTWMSQIKYGWQSSSPSWREMVIASHPISFKAEIAVRNETWRWWCHFELEKGVTLGQFVDLLMKKIVRRLAYIERNGPYNQED